MIPVLQIKLLGDFQVSCGGEPLKTLVGARLQHLLAYLVLHSDSPQPRSQVAFTFWPDSSEAHALLSLRQQIHALRRALPNAGAMLAVDSVSLQWLPGGPSTLDVAHFQSALAEADVAASAGAFEQEAAALQVAIDLYKGDLLPNCYDEWVLPEREKLREAFTTALERLIGLLSESADFGTVIAYAQRLLRYDPLREETYRLLMRLYDKAGDRAGAIRTYRRCEATLQRELVVEPGPETRALYEELLGNAPSLPGRVEKPNNLPAQASTFIGRERQLASASALLRRPEARLVTFTGAAGMGKTRLALQTATDLLNDFAHGAFFISLAPITDPNLVIPGIAQALGVRETASRSLAASLKDYLREKQILLVLDNFEQVAPAALQLMELLESSPGLKLLVTSRAVLHLRGEKEFPVPPLGLPHPTSPHTMEELAQHEAVALFVERAVDSRPDFALTRKNAEAVVDICRQLEGLPLAIELAAARIRVLSPQAIAARLAEQGGKLGLLVGGAVDLPVRQRALRNAIGWSYDLLDQDEQTLFRRLGVFVGGCSIQAAEAVALPPGLDALAGLGSLIDKSLLQQIEQPDGDMRYRLLVTIREYALERLAENREIEDAQRSHAQYFLALAEEAEPKLRGRQQLEWFAMLEVEHDNLRAALEWALSVNNVEAGLRLAAGMGYFWWRRSYLKEGSQWLERVLKAAGSDDDTADGKRALAKASRYAGLFTRQYGDLVRTENYFSVALSIFTQLQDKQGVADALQGLGRVAQIQSHTEQAVEFYRQSLSLYEELDDRSGRASIAYGLGMIAQNKGDYPGSIVYLEESLALYKEMGDEFAGSDTKGMLAWSLFRQGHYEKAKLLSEEVLETTNLLNDKISMLNGLALLSLIAQEQGDYAQAITLTEKAVAISHEIGYRDGMGVSMNNLGYILIFAEDYERAKPYLAKSLSLLREIGNRTRSINPTINLGHIELLQGDFAKAREWLGSALSLAQEIGEKRTMCECLEFLAWAFAGQGQAVRAARVFGAAERERASIGDPLRTHEFAVYERSVQLARESTDEHTFNKARAEGRAMPLDEVVRLALEDD